MRSKLEENNRRGVCMFTEPSGKSPSLCRIQREESHLWVILLKHTHGQTDASDLRLLWSFPVTGET